MTALTPIFDPHQAFAYRNRAIPALMQDQIREAMTRALPPRPPVQARRERVGLTSAQVEARRLRGERQRAATAAGIAELSGQGMNSAMIADAMGISVITVRKYLRGAMKG